MLPSLRGLDDDKGRRAALSQLRAQGPRYGRTFRDDVLSDAPPRFTSGDRLDRVPLSTPEMDSTKQQVHGQAASFFGNK